MKIFVLLSRVPFPLEKGDKLRAYHQVKCLHEKHEVFLCCVSDQQADENARKQLSAICSHLEILTLSRWRIFFNLILAALGTRPFQVRYFYQRPAHKQIKSFISDFKPDHIYCQLVRAAEYVKKEQDISKTLDFQDAFSANMLGRSRVAPWYLRPVLRMEYKRMLTYENLIFEYFDGKTIISEQDRNLIFHNKREEIAVVPNGVDASYFAAGDNSPTFDLVFTGNMNYPPNVDCARYLVKEVLPEVWKKRPEITMVISGANPSQKVRKLASDKVQVTGWVENIRDAYTSAKIFVAPMRLGTGMQNKLLEAMALGLPCITSAQVNNAIQATEDIDLLIGRNPEEVAAHILRLLDDEAARKKLAENGREFVKANYSWQKANETLEATMLKAVAERAK